jgi:two-component system LytT family sensor kinase
MQSEKTTYRYFIGTYIGWWLCWTILQTLVLYHTIGLSLSISIKDALLTNVFITLAGYAMINIMRFYQPGQLLRIIYSIGLSIISIVIVQWLATLYLSEDQAYLEILNRSIFIRCLFAWLMISLIAIMSWLWFYIREQQEIQERKTVMENLAREAELSKLRQQLQPHFLFNSLNSISALIGFKPEEARKMIQQLSDFLRGTLKKDDHQRVTFAEELQHLQLYLEIEKVRFGHRLKTQIENDERALNMKLPPLLLQPIVENAIKFGLYDTIGEIIIHIKASTENNYLIVSVKNPFDPTTAQPRQGTGFGLNSIQRRLYLLYARHDLLSTSQQDTIFTTTIKIPQSI